MRQHGMPVKIIVHARTQEAAIEKIDRLLRLLRRQADVTRAEFGGAVETWGQERCCAYGVQGRRPEPDPGAAITMAAWMFLDRLVVLCENEQCSNFHGVINKIHPEPHTTPHDVEMLLENWGQGSEEAADYCPRCGNLCVPQA